MIFELNMEECIKNSIQYAKDVEIAAKREVERQVEERLAHKYNEGYNTGRAEGEERGQQKIILETVKRLKAMGFSDEVVAEGTGLSLEQVKKL
ncbi:MAG: hypothetical protein K2J93_02210, partial [Anaeroplasmataceae bacterium]|nr:hypothetical protein [Anaeroplasmataceae bacterium]